MKNAHVLFASVTQLAGCDRRLVMHRPPTHPGCTRCAQCRAGEHGVRFVRRWHKPTCRFPPAGPSEYQTLADLPPIPPSFDEPRHRQRVWAGAPP